MKKIFCLILILILTFSCKENKSEKNLLKLKSKVEKKNEKTIFDFVFKEPTDLEYFEEFENNAGVVINYKSSKWEYSFQEIQNENQRIILFEKIIETEKSEINFKILDTIVINNLKENEFISIGLCSNNGEYDMRIFSIIEYDINNVEVENFTNIKKAWKANLVTKKIEKINEIKGIKCVNESYGL